MDIDKKESRDGTDSQLVVDNDIGRKNLVIEVSQQLNLASVRRTSLAGHLWNKKIN